MPEFRMRTGLARSLYSLAVLCCFLAGLAVLNHVTPALGFRFKGGTLAEEIGLGRILLWAAALLVGALLVDGAATTQRSLRAQTSRQGRLRGSGSLQSVPGTNEPAREEADLLDPLEPGQKRCPVCGDRVLLLERVRLEERCPRCGSSLQHVEAVPFDR